MNENMISKINKLLLLAVLGLGVLVISALLKKGEDNKPLLELGTETKKGFDFLPEAGAATGEATTTDGGGGTK